MKHLLSSKRYRLDASRQLLISPFITCVHGLSTNSDRKHRNKDICQAWFRWKIFPHTVWQSLTVVQTPNLWRQQLRNKAMTMSLMDLKCLFLVVLFQAFTLWWPKHQPQISQSLLWMEKRREFSMAKNNKKWDGQFNQQHWLILITLEFQHKILSAPKAQDSRLLWKLWMEEELTLQAAVWEVPLFAYKLQKNIWTRESNLIKSFQISSISNSSMPTWHLT